MGTYWKKLRSLIVPEHDMYELLKHREFKPAQPSEMPKNWPFKNPPPDWRDYALRRDPELQSYQKWLAKRGLHDPWLRNYIWKNEKFAADLFWRNPGEIDALPRIFKQRVARYIKGFYPALVLMVITVGIDKTFGIWESRYRHHH